METFQFDGKGKLTQAKSGGGHPGSFLRDVFAAMAMNRMALMHADNDIGTEMAYDVAEAAYRYADAMMAERSVARELTPTDGGIPGEV